MQKLKKQETRLLLGTRYLAGVLFRFTAVNILEEESSYVQYVRKRELTELIKRSQFYGIETSIGIELPTV